MSTTLQVNKTGGLTTATCDLVMDLTGPVQGCYNALSMEDFKASSTAQTVLGFTSCLTAITGPLLIHHGVEEIHVSHALKDFWGEVYGYIQTAYGSLTTTAGIGCMIPATGISLALLCTTCTTAAVAGQILLQVGAGIFGIASLLQVCKSVISFREIWECHCKLKDLSPEDALTLLQNEIEDPALLRQWQRMSSVELMEKIRTATPVQAKALIREMRWELTKSLILEALNMVLGLISIGLTVAGYFAGGYALVIAGTVLGIISVLFDIGAFVDAASSENIALLEKPWFYISAILTVIVMGATLYFTPIGWVMAAVAVAALIMLTAHLICILRIHLAE